jgi:hypothetical protein
MEAGGEMLADLVPDRALRRVRYLRPVGGAEAARNAESGSRRREHYYDDSSGPGQSYYAPPRPAAGGR